ncbi:MAG TPA: histidine kinase dimerization/phospho-acceptor domain-containing protein, partial [Candidatus Krumholzibacteria bacterium]|nr:histidine kinase dimerization/phospho-acceptor domain-containing protein [Candidatus Krumholzibacteria bacterium]
MERTRSFLAYFLPGVVLVAALLVGMTIEHDRRRSATMAYEESHVVREQQIFVARLCDSIVADVQVLARNARVRQLASGPSPGLAAAVGAEFADLAHYKRIYDQVRYLDDTGMEVVRVNHRGGRTSIVPADSLQSKADRYYVTMTMALDPGTIFASPLDLNIEHGVIEQPLLPMIRIGTPVADDLGRRRGMVIVNYRAAELLDPVRALKRDSASRMLMLDRDGFWLKGLDPSDEFGFMDADGGDRRMNARFPDAWRRMANDEAGAFELPAGFFAFTTLRPFGARWADMVSTRDVTGRETRPSSMDDYAWKLVSFTPREALTRDTRAFVGNLLAPGALVLLLFAAGAWRQAVAVARRREAERGLREANTELERRVAVRTTALQETSEALNAEIRERISAVLARRDLEQKLANTEGLRALGAVTAGIAHDFNNVLMPITGYAELAQFDTPRGSPASDHLDRVLKAADRAQELIEQILTFSGRRRLDPQFIDPPALLGEVAAQLAP